MLKWHPEDVDKLMTFVLLYSGLMDLFVRWSRMRVLCFVTHNTKGIMWFSTMDRIPNKLLIIKMLLFCINQDIRLQLGVLNSIPTDILNGRKQMIWRLYRHTNIDIWVPTKCNHIVLWYNHNHAVYIDMYVWLCIRYIGLPILID